MFQLCVVGILKIEFGLQPLKKFVTPLKGSNVLSLETRGKALLTHFDSGLTIYSHNQLYGVWRVVKRDKLPKTNRQLRLAIHTDQHSALLYSASDISVWKTRHIEEHPFLQRIGPDILNPNLTWRAVAERLQSKAFSGRALNSVYLDQAFLAGLGNYLRSEILFAARLHPARRAGDLDAEAAGRLSRAMTQLAERAYRTGGETAPKSWVRARRRAGEGWQQARHWAFNREELPCPECEAPIRRITFDGRRLYLCPPCQQEPAS